MESILNAVLSELEKRKRVIRSWHTRATLNDDKKKILSWIKEIDDDIKKINGGSGLLFEAEIKSTDNSKNNQVDYYKSDTIKGLCAMMNLFEINDPKLKLNLSCAGIKVKVFACIKRGKMTVELDSSLWKELL